MTSDLSHFEKTKVLYYFNHVALKLINVQCKIRSYRWENMSKINKRTCTTIPHFRVATKLQAVKVGDLKKNSATRPESIHMRTAQI